MTHVQTNGHGVHAEHAPRRRRRGWRRFTAPGWLRALWMAPLFWAIGAGIVCLLRSFTVWGPVWEWNVIVVVAFLTTLPLGFLAGIGAFDYWVYYALGGADARRGSLGPRRHELEGLLPRQHRPQGDRRPVPRRRRSSSSSSAASRRWSCARSSRSRGCRSRTTRATTASSRSTRR